MRRMRQRMFVLQAVLFANLSMTFQPAMNFDFSNVRVGMAPGSTLEQTEAGCESG